MRGDGDEWHFEIKYKEKAQREGDKPLKFRKKSYIAMENSALPIAHPSGLYDCGLSLPLSYFTPLQIVDN